MLIFIDESGDFSRSGESEYQYGVAAAVIIPEHIAPEVEHAYNNFVFGLSPSEKVKGEPKGHSLTDNSRLVFADLLGTFPDVLASMIAVDLAATDEDHYWDLPEGLCRRLQGGASKYIHKEMEESVRLLGRQVANLSSSQFVRIFTIGQAILQAFNTANLHYWKPEHRQYYNDLRFYVDRVPPREEIIFKHLRTLWIPAWSKRSPMETVEGIHTVGHPLIDKYTDESGQFCGHKLFGDNIRFVDSKHQWGIQMADIVANTLYRSLMNPKCGNHEAVGRIMKNAHQFPTSTFKLFAMSESGQGPTVSSKQRELVLTIEDVTGCRFPSSDSQ